MPDNDPNLNKTNVTRASAKHCQTLFNETQLNVERPAEMPRNVSGNLCFYKTRNMVNHRPIILPSFAKSSSEVAGTFHNVYETDKYETSDKLMLHMERSKFPYKSLDNKQCSRENVSIVGNKTSRNKHEFLGFWNW